MCVYCVCVSMAMDVRALMVMGMNDCESTSRCNGYIKPLS